MCVCANPQVSGRSVANVSETDDGQKEVKRNHMKVWDELRSNSGLWATINISVLFIKTSVKADQTVAPVWRPDVV